MVVVVVNLVVDVGLVETRSPFVSHSLYLWVVICGRPVCLLSVGKPHTNCGMVGESTHVVVVLLLSVVVVACYYVVVVLLQLVHVLLRLQSCSTQ